ncbi:MAG: DUF819 family protein [Gammaproteobacteria bacterium]|jgi:uncharacterized membrane protein|nr:DUF819 family protein [Gammaproteobacteria bacterium]
MAIIAEDNIFVLGAALFAMAWLGFWIDNKDIGKKISGVVWVLTAGMALSNFHVIPFKSPVYDFVGGYLIPLAIPLLLFKANLRKIFSESGTIMLVFCVASMATIIGAVLGFYLMDLGDIGPKVAGVYTGGYIGGAVNFLAVSQAVEMTSEEFSAAIGASSQVSNLALLSLIAIPSISIITRMIPSEVMNQINEESEEHKSEEEQEPFILSHVTGAIAISFVICGVSDFLGGYFDVKQYNILIITVLTISLVNMFPKVMEGVKGEFNVGMLIMYLFFAMVGAGTSATLFFSSAFNLFLYGMFIIVVHLVIVLTFAKIFKVDLADAIVASGAALVGPAVTAAIAISRGWRNLITPGIMCGIFGYAIATFIGVAVTKLLS